MEFLSKLTSTLESYGLDILPILDEDCYRPMGQIRLEQRLFGPLQEALARGEIFLGSEGITRLPDDLFQREHEAAKFAELLAAGAETTARAVALARLVTPLEKILEFQTTGNVGDNVVQRARLPLRGENLSLYVLRGPKGIIRLAMFSHGAVLCRRRERRSDEWTSNGRYDVQELKQVLLANNYIARGQEPSLAGILEEAQRILERCNPRLAARRPARLPGQRIIHGSKASRGRAVAKVLFGTTGRRPEDFDDSILVAAFIRPEDNTFFYHAAGIVSTGGGILSHAGLIAIQFHKPALIISGRWLVADDGSRALLYLTQEYAEIEREVCGYQVCLRQDIREREHRLREGDLVALDVDDGALYVLGHEHDALALHDGFRQLESVYRLLKRTRDDRDVLTLRGRRLRAFHQVAKIVNRLTDPVLARHAVHELLMGENLSDQGESRDDKIGLLRLLIASPRVGPSAREYLAWTAQILEIRQRSLVQRARDRIPVSRYTFEIISLRLELIRLQRVWEGALAILRECGLSVVPAEDRRAFDVDGLARNRLAQLRAEQFRAISTSANAARKDSGLRHFLRRIERIDRLLAVGEEERRPMEVWREELAADDAQARKKSADRFLLASEECGFELFPLIGWKAANLGEVGRVGGQELIPAWFVVTDHAFSSVFNSPLTALGHGHAGGPDSRGTLREAVERVLLRSELSDAQKSLVIRNL